MTADLETPDPYSPPVATPVPVEDDFRIRERFLRKEALLRAVGISYLITGSVSAFRVLNIAREAAGRDPGLWQVVILLSVFTGVYLFCGYGLLFLRSAARLLALLLSGVFILLDFFFTLQFLPLLQSPAALKSILLTGVDMVVPAIGLWLLISRAGRFLFSAEYRAIVEATPQLSVWRTPAMIAGLLIVLATQAAAWI